MAQATEAAAFEPEGTAALYRAIARLSEVDKAFVLLYLEDRPYE